MRPQKRQLPKPKVKLTDGAKALAAFQHLRAVKQQARAAEAKPKGRR